MIQQIPENQFQDFLPEALLAKRRELSRRYLTGQGIETGALHLPLWVPETATVRYVDRLSVADLRRHYPELSQYDLVEVDIVDNGEELTTIENHSLDFIIANHFLEHCENPLGAIRNHLLKLRQGGILYYAVPDKHLSFDQHRPLTDFAHLVQDDREGIETSRLAHYREWTEVVCGYANPEEIHEYAAKLSARSYSIHFHVWDFYAFSEFITQAQKYLNCAFEVEELQHNQTEIITVLRKVADPKTSNSSLRSSRIELSAPLPNGFNYCVDFPAAHQEILLPYVFVSGWVTAAQNSTIAQPVLCDAAHSVAHPLTVVPRPDVKAAFPQQQAIGFRQLIPTLELPSNASWQIEFLLNGRPQRFPCPFSWSAKTQQLLQTQKAQQLTRIRALLQCPVCGSTTLEGAASHLQCRACHSRFGDDRADPVNHYSFLPDDCSIATPTTYPKIYDYDPAALSILAQFPQGLVLDVSCGLSGAYYENVVRFGPVCYPTVDVLGTPEKLPFQTDSFDAVLLLAAEADFANWSELLRVLKPGGRLYATAPFSSSAGA